MAFVHGKNAALYIRDVQNKWRVITMFVNDATFPTKIDTPDTTTFGKGAKTVIPGIRDATFQIKGLVDFTGIVSGGGTGPAGPGITGYAGIDVLLGGLMGYQPTNGMFGPYLQIANGVFTQAAANCTAPAPYTLNADGTLATYTVTANTYTLGQVIFGPQGDGGYLGSSSGTAGPIAYSNASAAQNGNVKYMFDGVLNDYQISAPVKNAVSFSATFQVNGPFLRDSTTSPVIGWPILNSTT